MAGFVDAPLRLTYNGVIFPAQIQSAVTITPNYSPQSDRMVVSTTYRLSVVTILHDYMDTLGGLSVESGLPDIIKRLQVPGAPMMIQGMGLGTLWINTSKDGIRDIAQGPKPRLIEWTPVGNNISIRIRWEVEFTLVACPEILSTFYVNTPLSMEWQTQFSLDERGLTQIIWSGSLTLAQPIRLEDEGSPCATFSTPDQSSGFDFRKFVADNFVAPYDFIRTSQSYTHSHDNRTLTFSITDTETPSDNPYYPGCIQPQVTVSVGNRNGDLSMQLWNVTITGTIGVSKSHPRWYAWVAFWMIVEQRIRLFRQRSTISVGNKKGDAIWITNFQFSEEVFDRTMSFSVTIFCTCDLATIMQASGMWEPIRYYDPTADPPQDPGYPDGLSPYFAPWTKLTWKQYHEAMHDNPDPTTNALPPWGPYGFHNEGDRVGDYAYNICQCNITPTPPTPTASAEAPTPSYAISPYNDLPSPQNTWVHFQANADLTQLSNTHQHNLLTTPEPRNSQTGFDPGYVNYSGVNQGPLTVPAVTQRRTQTEYYVRFTGMAKRIGYPIPQVELTSYGGQIPTLVGTRRWRHTKAGYYGTQPLYVAMWDAWYTIPMAPVADTSTVVPDVGTIFDTHSSLDA